ncbi:MAG: hypothetical protein R3D80_11265 [Paracoccaceae bacterium]
MSTPPGSHRPIHPDKFAARVDAWHGQVQGTGSTPATTARASAGAGGRRRLLRPPYSHSPIDPLRRRGFDIDDLFARIARAKRRGVFVALSLDRAEEVGRAAL